MDKLKVASLFSGIGAFEQGLFKAVGKENVEIVFASEIDKYASKSYSLIYNHLPHGDITKIDARDVPDHDLLVAGFPCQSFSIAGKRLGFEETRGTLFFDVARILKEKTPKYFVLENVKGLVNHNKGETFATIKQVLEDLDYSISYKVLNSKFYGVPQNRERIFIVGKYNDASFNFQFPTNDTVTTCIKDILEESVEDKFFLSAEQMAKFKPKQKNGDIKVLGNTSATGYGKSDVLDVEGISPTIAARDYKGANQIMVEGNTVPSGHRAGNVYNTEGIAPTVMENHGKITQIITEGNLYPSGGQSGQVVSADGLSPCLDTMQGGNRMPKIVVEGNDRVLNTNDMYELSDFTLDKAKAEKVFNNLANKEEIKEGRLIDGYNGRVRADETTIGTLTVQCGSQSTRGGWKVIENANPFVIRKLTPKECFRLQGFDDSIFDLLKENGLSNSQLYKQAGNSITVNVVEALFKELFKDGI